MESTQVATSRAWLRPALRITGAGLLTATAAIHLDLYLTGFKNIPTIGWLFLLQVIAGFGLAALVLATGNRVIAAFAVLGLLAVTPAPADQAADGGGDGLLQRLGRMLAGLPMAKPAIAVLSGLGLVLLVAAVAGAGGPAPTTGPVAIKTGTVGGVTVLTNGKGLTVYTFAADSPGKSNCYSSCAAYWPPVTGTPSHAAGIPGTFGTTTRTDGTKQVTWNGHPLYTYVADGAPGQAKGNNLNLNGGLWKEIVVSG